jgi:glycosyltransferase involved in cell wall biosynthesis
VFAETGEAAEDRTIVPNRPAVSVIVPVFGDGSTLRELTGRVAAILRGRVGEQWELVLVNDGSPAATWATITDLAAEWPHVRGLNLLRNFGQHNALLAGIRVSRGDVVVTMDDDLQHPPEAIPALLDALDGVDVVYGTPTRRARAVWREAGALVVKAAFASVLGIRHAQHIGAFRALRGSLRAAFSDYRSPDVSIDVLLAWATTRIRAVPVQYDVRRSGRSGYTVRRLLSLAVTMVAGFSVWPLRLASIIGLGCAAFGLAVLAVVIGRYLTAGATVPGFAFLASVIAIFSGAQLFSIGIIGEYLARMYFRMMDRPAYIIQSTTVDARVESR